MSKAPLSFDVAMHRQRILDQSYTVCADAMDNGLMNRIRAELAPWLRTIENLPLAVSPELAARYSARVQGLLGYSVVAPGFTGYVDGMHPKRLIDRAYRGRIERGESTYEYGHPG